MSWLGNSNSRPKWVCWSLALLLSISAFSCAQQKPQADNTVNPVSVQQASQKADIYGAAAALEDLFNRRYADSQGIHLESVLSALGASAGFGSQMAIREAYIKTGQVSEKDAFVVVGTKDGQKYYYGDSLNRLLFEAPDGKYTVREIVIGGAKYIGARQLPDITEIVQYNAKTLGTVSFGIPRLPKEHEPREIPISALKHTWPAVHASLNKYQIPPKLLGVVPAIAAQKVIIQKSKQIDPSLSAKIVMESALPMSKVDPEAVINH